MPAVLNFFNNIRPEPGAALELTHRVCDLIHQYPEGAYSLRHRLAEKLMIDAAHLVLAAGSARLIDELLLAFLNPGDRILAPFYGYKTIDKRVAWVGAEVQRVGARSSFTIPIAEMVNALEARPEMLWIDNPGNPSGAYVGQKELCMLLERVPSTAIVVLDEAGADFVEPASRINPKNLIHSFPNVVVVRTFSKYFGLAGARIAYAVADRALAERFRSVQAPGTVNAMSFELAEAALVADSEGYFEEVRRERDAMCRAIAQFGIRCLPTHSNFLVLHVPERALALGRYLALKKIFVYSLREYGLPSYLRVSISSPSNNLIFLEALREFLTTAALSDHLLANRPVSEGA